MNRHPAGPAGTRPRDTRPPSPRLAGITRPPDDRPPPRPRQPDRPNPADPDRPRDPDQPPLDPDATDGDHQIGGHGGCALAALLIAGSAALFAAGIAALIGAVT